LTRTVGPIAAHGGTLVNRLLLGEAASVATERAERLPSITLSDVQLSDLEMIATGVEPTHRVHGAG